MSAQLKFACECNKGICVLSAGYNGNIGVVCSCYNRHDIGEVAERLRSPGFDPQYAYAFCIGCAAPVKLITIQSLNAAYEEGLVQDFLNAKAFDGLAERVFGAVRSSYGGTDAEIHAAIVGALKGK